MRNASGDRLPKAPSAGPQRLVLVGAGHAHLHTLQRIAEFTRRGLAVIAIAPESFWYSGMATGMLGGRYTPEQDQVDVEALVTAGGGTFLRERVLAINVASRTLQLASGTVGYEVLSLNLGSENKPLPGEDERIFPIKPLHHLWRLRQRLEAAIREGQRLRVVIAGGGASGCEIAANIRALAGPLADITIVAAGADLLPSRPARAAQALTHWLSAAGISVRRGTTLCRVAGGIAQSDCGQEFPFDYLVNATGLHAPAILRESGLPVSERGELMVDECLRSRGDRRVFGGGDCVHFGERGLAKIGVYAVRQGPILYRNLLATLEGQPLRPYRPQGHFLLILNLGGTRGLAFWRGFFWQGRAAFWVKDWIDRRFIARSRNAAG